MASARFEGRVRIEWLPDAAGDRRMRLLEDFAFVDADGVRWLAAAGRIVVGTGLPPSLQHLLDGRSGGGFRRAGVLHDIASQDRRKPSRDVHRMLYDALVCDGVDHATAVRVYAAARLFGEHWNGVEAGGQDDGHEDRVDAAPPIEVVEDGLDVVLGE